MNLAIFFVPAALITYLIGSVPFAVIIGCLYGVDVRQTGSGNIGAANVGRLLGRNWGVAVFLFDLAKGLVPTVVTGQLLARWLGADPMSDPKTSVVWLLPGLCAVLGHNHSVFIGFRGGKGVATSFGVALGFYPDLTYPALAAFVTYVIVVGVTRISSLGSITGSVVFPITYCLLASRQDEGIWRRWPFLLCGLLVAAMVLIRHRSNIGRLLSGREPRLGSTVRGDQDAGGSQQPPEDAPTG